MRAREAFQSSFSKRCIGVIGGANGFPLPSSKGNQLFGWPWMHHLCRRERRQRALKAAPSTSAYTGCALCRCWIMKMRYEFIWRYGFSGTPKGRVWTAESVD